MRYVGEGKLVLFFRSMNKTGLIRWNEWANSITGSLYYTLKYGLLIWWSWQCRMQIQWAKPAGLSLAVFNSCSSLLELFSLWKKPPKENNPNYLNPGLHKGPDERLSQRAGLGAWAGPGVGVRDVSSVIVRQWREETWAGSLGPSVQW